jgi:hypothetical protein
MSWGMIVVAAVGAGVNMYNASKNRKDAEGIASDAEAEKKIEQGKLDKQKAEYKAMTFKNPFADMENVYEDLTVNQKQAEFQSQQGSQQRANIMQGLKGAAGGSGVAGLAQAMASQGQLQTQQISASIGVQESRNQAAAAQGAGAVQIAERQGDQWLQQVETNRQATLLGMQMGESSGANLAHQNAQANQMNAQIAQSQATSDAFGTMANAAGAGTNAMGRKKAPGNMIDGMRSDGMSYHGDLDESIAPSTEWNG